MIPRVEAELICSGTAQCHLHSVTCCLPIRAGLRSAKVCDLLFVVLPQHVDVTPAGLTPPWCIKGRNYKI